MVFYYNWPVFDENRENCVYEITRSDLTQDAEHKPC